jgi:hypothetical protein
MGRISQGEAVEIYLEASACDAAAWDITAARDVTAPDIASAGDVTAART